MKKEKYVFCVDSDGCAMDTMTYKHQLFFGPLAADVFDVEEREAFLKEWDKINLYSKTRGVNRYVGLVMGLEFAKIPNIENLKQWVETTYSLSNASLEEAIAENPSDDLKKALEWSNQVNSNIKNHEGDALAFPGALEGLDTLHELGKVFVVSSANKEAVEEEWNDQGLMSHIDDLYCQDRGKKEDVIASLILQGYAPEKIMMIGDSPGDLVAAQQNGVAFYPILVGDEAKSWEELANSVGKAFVEGNFTEENQEQVIAQFWHNLEN
ncbi:HAD-IA family hydrolase [Streptococcus uberis]|uniref:HAD hydrolase-like protein n=1 Tax=Streptococcus uberis TaxID=1349 RepID=A0A6L6GB33_STRUB|nr:HAD hydrolase-like protein [Streptococcus uberis]MCK1219681.1 HAD family hydrolase [Streptococcus uberis]MCK1227880.1 HAD family hydrolase [Streptococcus uberis]MTB57174.1 HAD hydrolase-like protein [Streptococcus uberis]MTB97590.1 HAD hydrolase-like protein [Streptococcus uberis]MTC85194.1 HAD hydrolase-like protein [Streptococcus uberis]